MHCCPSVKCGHQALGCRTWFDSTVLGFELVLDLQIEGDVLLGGSAQTPRARAAIHGWDALQTEQAVSYDRSRNFYALLEDLPVRKNSLRGRQSKPSSCGEHSNVESAGTVTSRRQHLPVRREVRPEE